MTEVHYTGKPLRLVFRECYRGVWIDIVEVVGGYKLNGSEITQGGSRFALLYDGHGESRVDLPCDTKKYIDKLFWNSGYSESSRCKPRQYAQYAEGTI